MKPHHICSALLLSILCYWTVCAQSFADIRSCVSFIYLPDAQGKPILNGTGFFIGIHDSVSRIDYVYIVTAKHVLWKPNSKAFVSQGFLRLNQNKGDAGFVKFPMRTSGPDKNVFVHTDSTVDLVVVQGAPDRQKFNFKILSVDFFRTVAELKQHGLEEGTDVLIPAVFAPHPGEHQNYPIMRFGKLALVSGGERIKWENELQQLHLVESISIEGHSGAPVFIWFEGKMKPGQQVIYEEKRIRLIGVMQGYFGQWKKIGFEKTATATLTPISESHTGISAVVPVDLLKDILYSSEARKARGE